MMGDHGLSIKEGGREARREGEGERGREREREGEREREREGGRGYKSVNRST